MNCCAWIWIDGQQIAELHYNNSLMYEVVLAILNGTSQTNGCPCLPGYAEPTNCCCEYAIKTICRVKKTCSRLLERFLNYTRWASSTSNPISSNLPFPPLPPASLTLTLLSALRPTRNCHPTSSSNSELLPLPLTGVVAAYRRHSASVCREQVKKREVADELSDDRQDIEWRQNLIKTVSNIGTKNKTVSPSSYSG